ncbi:MAG: peptidoglycan DD-metalloendopeptidase family protein [Lachnospiraceae bacterium]|nr:peptidoglycan DD-metalloendopeptidase family protein [Lachnospiraceae bacterium]
MMRRIYKRFMAIVALVMVFSMSMTVYASSISELEEQVEEAEGKKAAAQEILDQLQSEQTNILDAIKLLDEQVAEYTAQITELEAKKDALEADIQVTLEELEVAKENEAAQYEAMKSHIQYAYESGDVTYIETLFTSSDVSDIVNQTEYAEQILNYDTNMLNEMIDIKKTIATTQLELETNLAAVEEIEAEVTENKEAVELMIEGKQVQAANYASSIEDYEEKIAAIQADIDATNATIAEMEAAAERARQEALAAGQDVQIYYTGGTLQWPVSTGGVITSPFGPRWGTVHQGLDIGCSTGTPIVACEAGTVIGAAYSSSMGNYVLIDHGGGVTTVYMHNSSLCVGYGQTVSRGEVIALAGSTGNSTGPHCHLGLRINGSYVDPLPYLQ